jgi:hypothetical protein
MNKALDHGRQRMVTRQIAAGFHTIDGNEVSETVGLQVPLGLGISEDAGAFEVYADDKPAMLELTNASGRECVLLRNDRGLYGHMAVPTSSDAREHMIYVLNVSEGNCLLAYLSLEEAIDFASQIIPTIDSIDDDRLPFIKDQLQVTLKDYQDQKRSGNLDLAPEDKIAMLGKLQTMKVYLEKIGTPQAGVLWFFHAASVSLFGEGTKAVRGQLVDLIDQLANECTKDLPHSQQPAGGKPPSS